MLPVTHKYTVNKSYQTVLFLHKTFNNSLLFIGKSVAQSVVYNLVQLNTKGEIIMEYIVAEETNHFCTIDEKTVVFLEAHLDRITFVDLSTHTFRHVPKVFEEKKKLNTISYFGKSRCYCVWEQLQNKIMFRFSYFFLEDDKPFHVYESVDKNYDLLVKVDDSSKFLWLQTKQNQTLTFSTYEFNQGGKGVLRSFKLNNNVDRQLLPNSQEFTVEQICEIRPNVYIFVRNVGKIIAKDVQPLCDFLIVDSLLKTVSKPKFDLQLDRSKSQMFHPVLTPYYCIFIYSTEEEGNENNYQISSYDIDYEAEQVQAGKIWLTNKGMSFTSMDFQKRILSYFEFDEKPKQIVCVSREIIAELQQCIRDDPRQIAVHFMLELYKDFDDDLIREVVEIIYLLS